MELLELIDHCRDNICFERNEQYELAPRTIMLNNFEVPEPVRNPLNDGDVYYAENPLNRLLFLQTMWYGEEIDNRLLKMGIIHLTKENAIASCKARHGIDPKNDNS